jgi:hypothetical protein
VQRCRWVRREEKREFVWLDGWLAGWLAGFTGWSRARNATKHAYRVWRVVVGGDDDGADTGHWTLDTGHWTAPASRRGYPSPKSTPLRPFGIVLPYGLLRSTDYGED